jgi:hypothetical protein
MAAGESLGWCFRASNRITELPQALFFMQYADFGWVTQV